MLLTLLPIKTTISSIFDHATVDEIASANGCVLPGVLPAENPRHRQNKDLPLDRDHFCSTYQSIVA